MAYFALLWKARTIEKYRSKYEKEKINSIIAANAELPRHTFCQKWKLYRYESQKKLHRTFRRWCPEGSRVSNFLVYLRTDQTFANFLVKSMLGFVGGVVLTYFWFMFFVFQLSISLVHATVMSSIIGIALTLGLAFSYRIRCLVFLLIPQFFSRVGRYTLTCYALVLILTGPATNTLRNSEVLSESLACGQEQVKSGVSKISKSMEKPLHLVKDTIDETMKRLKYLAAKMKELMVKIHRLTMSIAHVLQSSLAWLVSVEDTCNAKLGTPYEHCVQVLSRRKRDEMAQGLFNFEHLVKAVCFDLKSVDTMCVVGDFAKSSIVATVRKKLQTYQARIRAAVSVGVRARRSRGCCNASRAASQAAAGIVTEIRRRADPLLTWLSWSSCLTSFFLLLIIFRAKYYQQMFETRSRFDNRYITKELRDLDLRRLRQGRETVLPLNTRERAKYVSTTSFRLLSSEKVHLTRSIVFMVITTFKLLIHMVADYSLYWVLMNIRFHGRFQTPLLRKLFLLLAGDPTAGIQVSGSGPLAGMVRVLLEALSIPLAMPAPSPISCLPNPHPPDFDRYAQIGVLILLLWLFALFEPYGLRLRHVIMGHYQPGRARARAEWLYNHIIRTRGCFLKYARRKLHREYKYSSEETYTFKRWLSNFIPCRCLRSLLRIGPGEPRCLLCGTKQVQNDSDTHLKRCDTPSCPGTYCARCFTDIGQLCTICMSPEEYGDLSDASLEKGFSEDSDGDDPDNDQGDVNKPLIGTSTSQINENENSTHRNHITSKCERLPKSKNNGNQQTTTFHVDSLKQNIDNKCLHKFNKKIGNEQSDNELVPVVIRDKERELKSVHMNKKELSGVINTMKLLTTKLDGDNDNNKWNMHESNTFEYLVMNLLQPVDVFKKALIVRQPKHIHSQFKLNSAEKKESMKQLIPFLSTYSVNDIKTNGIINSTVIDKTTPELDITNKRQLQVVNKRHEISKRNTKSIKRNMTRSIKTKKILSKNLLSRLRKRKVYSCNVICKKPRNQYSYLVFKFQPQIKCRVYSINKSTFSKNLRKLVKKIVNTKKYIDYIQDTKCHESVKVKQLSNNIVTDCSSNIKPSDLKYSNTEETNKIISQKKIEDNIRKADCRIDDKQHKKHGFYCHLWMKTISALTKYKYTNSVPKCEPILSNIGKNPKRRKKYQVSEKKENMNTITHIDKQDNADARNFRISLYLKDHQECFKKQFQKKTRAHSACNTKNRQLDERRNNFALQLKEKTDKRKMKEAQEKEKNAQKELVRQLKLKAKAEENLKRMLKKEKLRHKGSSNVNEMSDADHIQVQNKNETGRVNDNKTISPAIVEENRKREVPNENETHVIKNKKTNATRISTESAIENITPVVQEHLKEIHTSQRRVSNCLKFFDFSNAPSDVSEEQSKRSLNKKIQAHRGRLKHCDVQCNLISPQTEMMSKGTQYENMEKYCAEGGSQSTVSCTSTQQSLTSLDSDEAKTDTTVCGIVKVDYTVDIPVNRRSRVKVTKNDRTTLTEDVRSVDVSTVTGDWWSPLVDKKTLKQNRRRGTKTQEKINKMNKEMQTGGKFVSFQSYTQLPPYLETKRMEESYSPPKRTSLFNLKPVAWRPAEKKESPSLVLRSKR